MFIIAKFDSLSFFELNPNASCYSSKFILTARLVFRYNIYVTIGGFVILYLYFKIVFCEFWPIKKNYAFFILFVLFINK